MNINEIRTRSEEFIQEIMSEEYLNYSGQKIEVEIEKIHERYKDVYTLENIRSLLKKIRWNSRSETTLDKRLRFLNGFLIINFLDRETVTFKKSLLETEAKSKVIVDSQEIPFRNIPIILSNEENRAQRIKLDRARFPVIEKLNETQYKKLEKQHELSRTLGFKNYKDMCEKLDNIKFEKLQDEMNRFLAETRKIYIENLSEKMEMIGIKNLKDAERHDVSFYFRSKEYDDKFQKEKMVMVLKKTLHNIGIDIDSQKNIILDLEPRPRKNPRACCFPIKPPEKVILMIHQHGGYEDYSSLFHECGHSAHFANVSSKLAFEFRYLGDNSITESFAFLFEHLIENPEWLKQYIGLENPYPFIKLLLLKRLFFIRRYAAKLNYELELHTGKIEGKERAYRKHLEKALVIHHPEIFYLTDLDDFFYCVYYIRAWQLESYIRHYLEENFGPLWFNNKKSGTILLRLWKTGQKYMPEELIKKLGYDRLDNKHLYEDFKRMTNDE